VSVKNLELAISHRGETSLRIAQKKIKMLDGPHLIYSGDKVENFNRAKNTIDHYPQFPPDPKAKIIGVYEFIIMPDGTKLLRFFDQVYFDRLAAASAKQNKGPANALYTSHNGGIDPGFAVAKCIKHGFKGIPKCKTFGIPVQMDEEDEVIETQDHGFANVVDDDTPVTNEGDQPPVQIVPETEDEF